MDANQTVEVFYDGECPLCMREIRVLQRLDRRARIRFTDIARPEFDPDSVGLSLDTLMGRIHGRLPGGEVIEGVEVFRRLYDAVGFGPLVALTLLIPIGWARSTPTVGFVPEVPEAAWASG